MASTQDATTKINAADAHKSKRFIYPMDLGSSGEQHVAQFNIVEYSKKDISRFEIKTPLATIRLPMPPNLTNSDGLEYEEFSAPLLTNLTADTLSAQGISDFGSAAANAVGSVLKTQLDSDFKLAESYFGVSINPRNTNVFKSPKAREHQFEYSLVARNKEESDMIRDIINLFRISSYPSANAAESLFKTPELFVIRYLTLNEYSNSYMVNKYLPIPLPCALVGMNVSYYSMGEPAFFRDTFAPIEVKLTLMFKEMEIDTKQTLKDRYGDIGT